MSAFNSLCNIVIKGELNFLCYKTLRLSFLLEEEHTNIRVCFVILISGADDELQINRAHNLAKHAIKTPKEKQPPYSDTFHLVSRYPHRKQRWSDATKTKLKNTKLFHYFRSYEANLIIVQILSSDI